LPREITAKLISIVPKSSPATLSMMARYAASINIPQGQELLLKVADQRIANYANWSVKQEYEDGEILQILADEITKPSGNTNVPAVAQRFAQLYSYVIQKYVKAFRSLHASQKTQLVTVIIETENKCIRNMIGSHPNIRKAIEDEQLQTLMDEHNKLLGSDTARGELPTKYNFYYGTDGNAPLTLSDPK